MESMGEAYSRSYNNMAKSENEFVRSENQYDSQIVRLLEQNQRFQLSKQREHDLNNFHNQRLGLEKQRLDQMSLMSNQRIQLIQAQIARIRAQTQAILSGKSGGLTPWQQLQAQKAGVPYKLPTSSGGDGTYVMAPNPEKNRLSQVINAYPQLVPMVKNIQDGAKYYMDKPDQFKKYIAAVTAMWNGNLSSKQEQILEKSGIAQNTIIEATETLSRVMNMGKTDHSFIQLLTLYKPMQGETVQSYTSRLNSLMNDNARRFYQAQYEYQHMPTDKASQDDENKYIDDQISKDNIWSSGASSSSLPPGVTEAKIQEAMKKFPNYTREQIIQILS
jgi:hypothetical protein